MSTTESGLQRERTRLSWRRTTLSAAVAVILLEITLLTELTAIAAVLVGVGVAVGWFVLVLVGYRRIRTLDAGDDVALTRSPAVIALLVIVFAVVGLAVTIAVS